MNRLAYEYLKDLQQAISTLVEDQGAKLEAVQPEIFVDDVNENVLTKLDEVLYEIETIMGDVEEGYYSEDNFEDGGDDYNNDNIDDF